MSWYGCYDSNPGGPLDYKYKATNTLTFSESSDSSIIIFKSSTDTHVSGDFYYYNKNSFQGEEDGWVSPYMRFNKNTNVLDIYLGDGTVTCPNDASKTAGGFYDSLSFYNINACGYKTNTNGGITSIIAPIQSKRYDSDAGGFPYTYKTTVKISLAGGSSTPGSGSGNSGNGNGNGKCTCVYSMNYAEKDEDIKGVNIWDRSSDSDIIHAINDNRSMGIDSVYPFEGPNYSSKKYRDLLYAYASYNGPVDLTMDSESNVSITLLKSHLPSYRKYHVKCTDYRSLIGNGSNSNLPHKSIPGGDIIGLSFGSVSPNTSNSYEFNLDYTESSEFSQSSESYIWVPDCWFIFAKIEITNTKTQTISEKSHTIGKVNDSYYESFTGYVYSMNEAFQESNNTGNITETKYTAWRSVPTNAPTGSSRVNEISVDKAMSRINELIKEANTDESFSNVSSSCPKYKSVSVDRQVLATYCIPGVGINGVKTPLEALGALAHYGIPRDFGIQLDNNFDHGSDSVLYDILTYSEPGTNINNIKYVATMRKLKVPKGGS